MSISRFTLGFTQTPTIQLRGELVTGACVMNLRAVMEMGAILMSNRPTGDTPALDGPDVCPRPTIYQRGAVRVAWSQEKPN